MNNLHYAPEFRLHINGQSAPAALRASVTSVSFESGLEGADRVELALANTDLRWLDHPLLGLDNSLALELGYSPGPLVQVFNGEIVAHTASFPSGSHPTLTVAAQDRRRRLQQGTKTRWFVLPVPSVGNFPLSDPAVAAIVAAENALMPVIAPVAAALATLLGEAEAVAGMTDSGSAQKTVRQQAGESDDSFLRRIAAENGWEMVIEHSGPLGGYQLRFFSPLDHLTPDLSLKWGQSLIDFSPRISNIGQIASVSAYIWVPQIKTRFTVTVGWDWDRMALTIDIRPAFTPAGQGPADYLIDEPLTPLSAPRKIISELIPRLNQRQTGSGSAVGDPRLIAGAVVRLEGLGQQFGGLYRVTSASHSLDSGGYHTRFEVRKEIWFGSIPLPQQGAVKITSPGPFG